MVFLMPAENKVKLKQKSVKDRKELHWGVSIYYDGIASQLYGILNLFQKFLVIAWTIFIIKRKDTY